MADSIVGSVIEYLGNDDDALRNIALNWLCEGYLDDPTIASTVFQQWDARSSESAFTQFPMLSFFPIPPDLIGEACQRAADMARQGRELTSLTTRSAGKLLEQVVRLPARQLESHCDQIAEVAQSHKIFFRVDAQALRHRLALLQKDSDSICGLLDRSIETLIANPEDRQAVQQGQHALEALRMDHPNTIDLASVLSGAGSEHRPSAVSLQLSLLSLSQFADDQSLESLLAPLLHSPNQSLLSLAMEALVRRGSGQAAQMLVEQFATADSTNRAWIARGLQRMRVHHLAPLIAQLRDQVTEQALWMMLLVAEMQQLDPQSSSRVIEALDELEVVNPALIDAGMLYTFVCSTLQGNERSTDLEECFRDFLIRVQSGLKRTEAGNSSQASDQANGQDPRAIRRQRSKQMEQLFKKRRI